MARGASLDVNQLLRILPHRPPMLLLDRVIELEPPKSARGIKAVSANEPAVRGHFPTAPVFPAFLCLEAMSQLMCVLIYASDALDPATQQFALAGVEKAKFRQSVVPGDRMELSIRVLHHRSNIWKCSGVASVDDVLCVEAELLAAVQDCEEYD
jgi:3-hydroxyacyl-[acyl-carrier-protein] dehydratase